MLFYDVEAPEILQIVAFCLFPNVGAFVDRYLCADELKSKDGQPTWFDKLNKPSLSPPAWVFGSIWMVLFTMIGYASFLVYSDGDGFDGFAFEPLLLYVTHLIVVWLYTPVLFLGHNLRGAFFISAMSVISALACGVAFQQINEIAGYLFMPYVLWSTYSCAFSYCLWKYNPNPVDFKLMQLNEKV